jgi:hypothetical protein
MAGSFLHGARFLGGRGYLLWFDKSRSGKAFQKSAAFIRRLFGSWTREVLHFGPLLVSQRSMTGLSQRCGCPNFNAAVRRGDAGFEPTVAGRAPPPCHLANPRKPHPLGRALLRLPRVTRIPIRSAATLAVDSTATVRPEPLSCLGDVKWHPCRFVNSIITTRPPAFPTFSHIIGTVVAVHRGQSMGFNFIITICVGAVLAFGAVLTYKHRMAEAEMEGNPMAGVAMVSPTQFVKNVAAQHAALPKWDDKNWKGLTYHPPGYYKKKAEAEKEKAAKQTAAR